MGTWGSSNDDLQDMLRTVLGGVNGRRDRVLLKKN